MCVFNGLPDSYSFISSFIIYLFVCSFVYSFIHSFIYLFIYKFIYFLYFIELHEATVVNMFLFLCASRSMFSYAWVRHLRHCTVLSDFVFSTFDMICACFVFVNHHHLFRVLCFSLRVSSYVSSQS